MYVNLEDAGGNPIEGEVWVLPGSELYWSGKLAYRRTGRKSDITGKPIYKQT